LSKSDVDKLIKEARELKKRPEKSVPLRGKKVASLFFENSTRTRLSSETAAKDLGAEVNGFAGAEGTSVQKGEPLVDTVRMLEQYGHDLIFMRHNLEGSARLAADHLQIPLINCGDGSANHPTQTLLDLMTIEETFGQLDGLKVALVGDLKYGRTGSSLLQACELYDIEPWLVTPPGLEMASWRVRDFEAASTRHAVLCDDLEEVLRRVDVVYMTRIQRERFPKGPEGDREYERVSGLFSINEENILKAKKKLIVLHPLPRCKENLEIAMEVDETGHAKYIEQAGNGLWMRQAILLNSLLKIGYEGRYNSEEELEEWEPIPIANGKKVGEHLLYRISNGTIIDHIEAGNGERVRRVLNVGQFAGKPRIFAEEVRSERYGAKDVLGFQDTELTTAQLNQLSIVSERARVNIIRDGRVHRKGRAIIPNRLEGVIQCQNPKCIQDPRYQEHTPSIFYTESREPLSVRCNYCDKPMEREEIKLI